MVKKTDFRIKQEEKDFFVVERLYITINKKGLLWWKEEETVKKYYRVSVKGERYYPPRYVLGHYIEGSPILPEFKTYEEAEDWINVYINEGQFYPYIHDFENQKEHDIWDGVYYAECIESQTGIRSGQEIVKGNEYRIIDWFKREVLYLEGFEWGWGVEYFKPSSKKPDAITCTIGIDVEDALSGTHTISLKYHVSFSIKEELDQLEVAYHIEKCLQDYLNKKDQYVNNQNNS